MVLYGYDTGRIKEDVGFDCVVHILMWAEHSPANGHVITVNSSLMKGFAPLDCSSCSADHHHAFLRDDPNSCQNVSRRMRTDPSPIDGKSEELSLDTCETSSSYRMSSIWDDELVFTNESAKRARRSWGGLEGGVPMIQSMTNCPEIPHPSSNLEMVQPVHSLAAGVGTNVSNTDMFPPETKLLPSFSLPTSSSTSSRLDMRHVNNSLLPLPFNMEPRTIEEMIGDRHQDGKWKRGNDPEDVYDIGKPHHT